jgi:hypothetical protein
MLWFYERNDESLRLETRFDNDSREFVVIVRYPDGRKQTERFSEADACRAWLVVFERNLEQQQWARQCGGPAILADGWPDKPLI